VNNSSSGLQKSAVNGIKIGALVGDEIGELLGFDGYFRKVGANVGKKDGECDDDDDGSDDTDGTDVGLVVGIVLGGLLGITVDGLSSVLMSENVSVTLRLSWPVNTTTLLSLSVVTDSKYLVPGLYHSLTILPAISNAIIWRATQLSVKLNAQIVLSWNFSTGNGSLPLSLRPIGVEGTRDFGTKVTLYNDVMVGAALGDGRIDRHPPPKGSVDSENPKFPPPS